MKIMNQLQKSGMKFLTDKKKILLTTLFFITANTFVFAQDHARFCMDVAPPA